MPNRVEYIHPFNPPTILIPSYETYPKKIQLPLSEANWGMHEKEQEKMQ
jgi:hypothetical protein